MSAANEKKERKAAAAAEQAKKNRAFKRNAIIIVVILAILLGGSLVINSNVLYTSTTAVQIGDTKYSPAEYNFYYNSAYTTVYNNIYSTYGELTAYLIDTETPLDEQIYMFGDGEMTWHDYLNAQALSEMTNVTILYDAAIKAGYTLSDEDKASLDETIAQYEVYAGMYGYSSVDSFLTANYGKGMDAKLFREIMEMQTIASAYSSDLNDSFTYTADEIEAYYTENKDSFDYFTYHSYFVGTTIDAFADLSDEEKIAAASEAAAAIAEASTVEEFTENVVNFVSDDLKASYESPSATMSVSQGSSLSDNISEWMLDASRTTGDTTVIDTEGGSYAVMFVSRNDNHYNTVSARHILCEAEASEDGTYTDEALAVAKENAEKILAEWEADPTEEYFAELANAYSSDTSSNTNGGLYEDIFQDQMVEEFNDFLFEEHRLPGDTAIVYGSNGYYAGYHVVYYVGEGGVYSDILAEDAMRSTDYSDAVTALSEGYDIVNGFGMRFVGR